MGAQRRTVLYTGQVQGVGFRWTVLRELEGLSLTGFVRNLPDGSVRLVIEGTGSDLDDGLQRIRRSLARNIRHESAATSPATGEFDRLEVRR